MRKQALRLIIFSLLFILIAAPSMNFDVMLPASVSFPGYLKSVAMIDRSTPEDNVGNVIEDNLPEAKSWAQTAWGNYKNKKSRDYLYDLNRRINQNEILQQQLEE